MNSSSPLNIGVAGYDSTVTTGNLILAASLTLTANAGQSSFQFSGFNNVTVGGVVASGTNANAGLVFGPTLPTTTLYLTGANTFQGSLTIQGGIVSTGPSGTLGNSGTASSIGQSSTITINGLSDNNLGGTLQYANWSGTNESTNVQFTLGANAVLDASGSNQITFANTSALTISATSPVSLTLTGTGSGVFDPKIVNGSGSGTVSLIKTSAGSWTLGTSETYTGATTINAGTLSLATGATLASTGLTLNGGTLIDANGTSQSFSSTTLGQGGSGIEITANNTILSTGTLTHSVGRALAFTIPAGLTGSSISIGNTTVTNGMIGGWAVVNGTNWATVNSGASRRSPRIAAEPSRPQPPAELR